MFLNAIGISIQNFENRQGLLLRWQLARHVPCRGDGHHSMEADVVFAAKGAGVGQSGGGDERAQLGAAVEFFGECGEEFVDWSFLHQRHQRFERAEGESIFRFSAERFREAQVGGHGRADGGDQDAAADIRKKLATGGFAGRHVDSC